MTADATVDDLKAAHQVAQDARRAGRRVARDRSVVARAERFASERGLPPLPDDGLWGPCTVAGCTQPVPKRRTKTGWSNAMCKRCLRRNVRVYNGILPEHADLEPPEGQRCELCGADGKLQLDHNHETGRARGWLCSFCNGHLIRLADVLWETGRTHLLGLAVGWVQCDGFGTVDRQVASDPLCGRGPLYRPHSITPRQAATS